MSPKKKSAPAKSALKDDLINSLFESEGADKLAREKKRASSPPPPPQDDGDRIYNFDTMTAAPKSGAKPAASPYENDDVYDASKDNTRSEATHPHINDAPTLSIVRHPQNSENELPMFEVPADLASSLALESDEASSDEDEAATKSAVKPTAPPPKGTGSNPKLQRLEDVLRRLKPTTPPTAPPKTAPSKAASPKAAPPKVAPQMAPASAPERAPTEPVRAPVETSSPSVSDSDEKTVALAVTPTPNKASSPIHFDEPKTSMLSAEIDPEGEQFMPTEIRPNSPGARFREEARQAQPGAAIFSSAEAALRQSENLRIAQKRISDLENELERVRRENESLRSAGETLRRRMDELQANAENAEANAQESKKIAEEERKVLKGQIQSRDRELSEMKGRLDDAENRLESNFRKIRVRERDLEHRIEIIKAESQSITASKDRMILELKRQIDQISSELNHAKAQVQETFGQFKEKQETARRAVRALRIALTVLEGEEDSGTRKAE